MDWQERYRDKTVSAKQAVSVVKSGDLVTIPVGREPPDVASALVARKEKLRGVTISVAWPYGPYAWYLAGCEESFRIETNLISLPQGRKMVTERRCDPAVTTIRLHPDEETRDIDVLLVEVSPPDKNGFCSFGSVVGSKPYQVKKAKIVIGEVNSRLLRTYGENYVHVSDVDYLVEHLASGKETSRTDITGRPLAEPSSEVKDISQHVLSLLRNGDTIQIGVGSITEGVLRSRILEQREDIGWHSEATPEEVITLVRQGIITGRLKSVHSGKAVATAVTTRTQESAAYVDQNPLFELYPIEYTNDIKLIAAHDNMVAINTALAVDLTGQVTAETAGERLISVAGGQPSFAIGAVLSRGGRNLTLLASTHDKGAGSCILPRLPEGAVITLPRTVTDYVITEYGIARLRGKTLRQRVEEMIAIAHPDYRAELKREAQRLY